MSNAERNANEIAGLANSSLNDESRLQVLIHLSARVAADLARLRNQLNLAEASDERE